MKKIVYSLFLIFSFFILTGEANASSASLYLSPSTGNYTVGNTFTVEIKLNSQSFKVAASQGQRKSLLFALKLAELEILKEFKQFPPILLLDDAAEYLDELDQLTEISAEQAARASILVAEAKIYANDAALHISEKLLELGGSRASLSQHNLDQHWRNARVHTLHDPVRWKFHAIGDYYLNGTHPARHAWI